MLEMQKIVPTQGLPRHASHEYDNVPVGVLLSPYFSGRDHELVWLRSRLQSNDPTNKLKRVGVHGMTGMGKTQLVCVFVHRMTEQHLRVPTVQMLKYYMTYKGDYKARFYLLAGAEEKLDASFQEMLECLNLPEQIRSERHLRMGAIRNWLANTPDWLLLIDNVEADVGDTILEVLPLVPKGHVILTSQRQGAMERIAARPQSCLELTEPSADDALALFMEAGSITRSTENDQLAQKIVQKSGRLPHAIDQSASYVKARGIGLEVYLQRMEEEPQKASYS